MCYPIEIYLSVFILALIWIWKDGKVDVSSRSHLAHYAFSTEASSSLSWFLFLLFFGFRLVKLSVVSCGFAEELIFFFSQPEVTIILTSLSLDSIEKILVFWHEFILFFFYFFHLYLDFSFQPSASESPTTYYFLFGSLFAVYAAQPGSRLHWRTIVPNKKKLIYAANCRVRTYHTNYNVLVFLAQFLIQTH